MKVGKCHGKYLGCTVQRGRLKLVDFTDILLRHTNKLQGWKVNSLSFAGWDVLIKSALNASLNHLTSALKILKGILLNVDKFKIYL